MPTFKVVSQIVVRKNVREISNKYLKVVGIAWPPDRVLTITSRSSDDHSAVAVDRYALLTAWHSAQTSPQTIALVSATLAST